MKRAKENKRQVIYRPFPHRMLVVVLVLAWWGYPGYLPTLQGLAEVGVRLKVQGVCT